jgi:drug/metabolite transporter (DMT)-like permease
MTSYAIGTSSLLVSNLLLSSYPILIKTYVSDISTIVQVLIRVVVYICLALPFLIINGEGIKILTALIDPKYLAISAINLVHIYSSYKGFEYLNTGISLTTFYAYPIIQVILSHILLGTELTRNVIYHLFGCLFGIAILNRNSFLGDSKNIGKGFAFITLAALTEALINVFYKAIPSSTPFMSLYTLYAPAFIFLLIGYGVFHQKEVKESTWNNGMLTKVILFNLLIGGVGYLLRLYSLSKISINWFSALSFTSSISAFVLGWLFFKEQITIYHLVGTALIFYNIYWIH